jgi:hypothetical protein
MARPFDLELDGSIFECSKHGVYLGLIARALSLKPFENICIHAERNRGLSRNGLEASAHDSAHNMLYICLGVFGGKLDILVLHPPDTRQVRLRGFQRGSPFHVLSPFGKK